MISTTAAFRSPTVATGRPSQTDIALKHMTPETAAVLTRPILDARIGQGTVAGGLNDSYIFRVQGSGSNRQFVPDSKLAVELLATPAGPKILRQLEAASSSADWAASKSNLTGFVLPRDTQAVAAAAVLADLEPGGPPLKSDKEHTPRLPHTIDAFMDKEWKSVREGVPGAGAWNSRGWITFMPDAARMMLTAAGAYVPDAKNPVEAKLRRAGRMAPYIGGTVTHEVQHSITSRKGRYENVRWLEEGIANIFSKTPTFLREQMGKAGVSVPGYAGHLAHPPSIETNWGAWKRPEVPAAKRAEKEKEQKERYADSQPILRQLLRMSGAGLNSNEGKNKARAMLQGTELNRVPGNLAKAIIEHHDLDSGVYERLRQRIIVAVKDPKSVHKMAEEFGIDFAG